MATALEFMNEDPFNDTGPYASAMTSNVTPGGIDNPVYQGADYAEFNPTANSPHGGIDYINQAVGGVSQVRDDVMQGVKTGFRSYRSKSQPFNGDFLGGVTPVTTDKSGYVGFQRKNTAKRAMSADSTNLPTDSEVRAAFLNPALSVLLNKITGK